LDAGGNAVGAELYSLPNAECKPSRDVPPLEIGRRKMDESRIYDGGKPLRGERAASRPSQKMVRAGHPMFQIYSSSAKTLESSAVKPHFSNRKKNRLSNMPTMVASTMPRS